MTECSLSDPDGREAPTFPLRARLRVPNILVLRGDDVRVASGGYSVGNLNLALGGVIVANSWFVGQ